MMQSNMFAEWREQTNLFSDIYSVRNRVHAGGDCSEYDKRRYEHIKANATQMYIRMLTFLIFLVEGVKAGYPLSQELVEFAEKQEVSI